MVNIAGAFFVDLFHLDKLSGTDLILPVILFWVIVVAGGYGIHKAYGFLSRQRD